MHPAPVPEPTPPWLAVLLLCLVPFVFVGFWMAVCFLLGSISGWRDVAANYEDSNPIRHPRFKMIRGRVGFINYNNCLTAEAAPEGLHLSVWKLFRAGHPPLLIPWDAMHNAQAKTFFFSENIHFDVGSPRCARMALPRKIFEGYAESLLQPGKTFPPPLPDRV